MTGETFDPVAYRRDVPLDHILAESLIAEQLPEFKALPVRHLGSGWDNDAYLIGEDWVIRFPKRQEVVDWLEKEARLTRVLARHITVPVPVFEKWGEPTERFPLPFAGYRRIPGVAMDEAEWLDEDAVAADMGLMLTQMHGVPTPELAQTGLKPLDEGPEDWRRWIEQAADGCRDVLRGPLLASCEPYLDGRVSAPAPCPLPPVAIHGDLDGEHLLADARAGRLSGVIDFADAALGDPAIDFSGLVLLRGESWVRKVLNHYDRPLDEHYFDRLRFYARTFSLIYLGDAVCSRMSETTIVRGLDWVQRTFG